MRPRAANGCKASPLSEQLWKPVSLRVGERIPDFMTRRSRATTFRKSAKFAHGSGLNQQRQNRTLKKLSKILLDNIKTLPP
jgi:hypothetical protein